MSPGIEVQIARMFVVGFHGTAQSRELQELMRRGVEAVVLFSRNIETPSQVLELTGSLASSRGRPPLVCVDQEGGRVRRLRQGFTDVPPMRVLGRHADPELARSVGRVLGRELGAVGIHLNFAPVLDVDSNPKNPVIGDRSFGADPDLVAELGEALARGLEEAGVIACGKHFPGHGDTDLDSHHELPRLAHDRERLERVELVPFRRLSRAGIPALMTAHVLVEALDPEHPASMSPSVLSQLLRREIGYAGVVFSDDLEMKAVADHYTPERAAVLAVQAGCDALLVCHSADVAHRMLDALIAALACGELNPLRIAEANRRLARLRQRMAPATGVRPGDLGVLGCPEHRAIATRLLADGMVEAEDPTEARRPSLGRRPS